MTPDKTITIIINLLQESGRKQKELTDFLGITPNALTDWKSGRIKSYRKHLPKIAEFFNVTVDYLLGNESPALPPELPENTVAYRRNGETITKRFTQEQMRMVAQILDAIPDEG